MESKQSIEKWCKIIQSANEDGLNVIETVLVPFFTGTDQFTTKDPDKLAHYHEHVAKVTAQHEEQMKQVEQEEQEQAAFESVLMYERNRTMRMIGRQSMGGLMENEELKAEFDDIRAAHKYDFNFDLSMNSFLLGYIWGKRAERARKGARA